MPVSLCAAVERQRYASDWENDPTFKRTPKNLAEGKYPANYLCVSLRWLGARKAHVCPLVCLGPCSAGRQRVDAATDGCVARYGVHPGCLLR